MNADFGPKPFYKASTARCAAKLVGDLKQANPSFSFFSEGNTVAVHGDHKKAVLEGYAQFCERRDASARIGKAQELVNRSRGIRA